MRNIAIIGGGISGLAAGWYLKKGGCKVRIFEKDRPGGVIRSVHLENTVLDLGPNSLRDKDGSLRSLINDLELEEQTLEVSESFKTRCIVRNGELQFLRPSPLSFLGSPILSLSGKLRLFSEPFRGRGEKAGQDESVRSFLERRIGEEATDYLADPVFSGIYAGDISRLSKMEILPRLSEFEDQFGSVTKGALKSKRDSKKVRPMVFNFKDGIETLTSRLAERLAEEIIPEAVHEIRSTEKGFKVHTYQSERIFDEVLTCIPAYELSKMIDDPELKPLLQEIPYPPVLSTQLLYRKEEVGKLPDGFGFLVPRKEGFKLLGAIWKSSIFPDLSAPDLVQFNLLSGGAHTELSSLEASETEQQVIGEFQKIMGISAKPARVLSKYWPKAIPQLNVGYENIRTAIASYEEQHPGFHVGGNFRWGVSVPECIGSAHRFAKEGLL